jgi:group II intron reverse transcriptase/maturase
MGANVGWIVDADIRGFFDNLDRGVLRELLHRRVKDGGIDRLIGKWFHAGVLDGGEISHPDRGTPQGGVASPLLANIYLHHVLDEWFAEEVQPRLRGRSFLIRFADDFVIGCELEADARRVMEVLPKRMRRHGLEIHTDKTRLVRFRRPSDEDDDARPGTFDFLGFTHYWGRTRRGRWVVKHRTARKRLARAMRAAYEWCRDHRHWSVRDQSAALAAKLRGHYRYYGVSGNYHSIDCLHHYVIGAWRKWLSTRSSKSYVSWPKLARLLQAYPLPRPRIQLALR